MASWYRTGKVNIVSGEDIVAGVDVFWDTAVNKPMPGDMFTADNQMFYEIVSINSDEELELDRGFEGVDVVDGTYAIIPNTSATDSTRLAQQITDLVENFGGKITVSTSAPTNEDGKDGDIWIVVGA